MPACLLPSLPFSDNRQRLFVHNPSRSQNTVFARPSPHAMRRVRDLQGPPSFGLSFHSYELDSIVAKIMGLEWEWGLHCGLGTN